MDIRDARPEDALAVAGVHVRSWQAAYRGLLPDEYLDSLRAEDRALRYTFGSRDPGAPHTLVAIERGAVVGFATIGAPGDSATPDTGELMALYVEPLAWGTGVGRTLVARARADLHRRGFSRGVLWVLAGNVRADRFYERDGWTKTGDRRLARVWGIEVEEIGYSRPLGD